MIAAGRSPPRSLAPGSAQAQQKLVLKASDVHPAGYPTVVAVENMGKKLAAATNGRHHASRCIPSMQLGGEKEAIEQAQVGAIAFARVSVGALGPVVDDLNVFNLPYVFRNTAHMQKVIDGADRPGTARQGDQQRQGPRRPVLDGCRRAQFLRHQEADQDHRRPQGPEDPRHGQPDVRRHGELDGRQRRRRWATTRCSPRCRPASIDGAENNPPSFVFDNHYQVAKFYTLDEHLIVPEMLVMSKKIFDSLSKDDQALRA